MIGLAEQMRLASIRVLRGIFAGIGQLLLAADRLRAEEAAERQRLESNGAQDPLSGWEHQPGRTIAGTRATAGRDQLRGTSQGPREQQRTKPSAPRSAKPGPKSPGGPKPKPQAKAGLKQAPKSQQADKRKQSRAARKKHDAELKDERPRWRSLDSTGNVRLLTDDEIAELAADQRAAAGQRAAADQRAAAARSQPAAAGREPTRQPDQGQVQPAPAVSASTEVVARQPAKREVVRRGGASSEVARQNAATSEVAKLEVAGAEVVKPEVAAPVIATSKAKGGKPGTAKTSVTEPTAKATGKTAATAKTAAKTSPAQRAAATPRPAATARQPATAPPIPGYDGLTIASLRARLRNLNAAEVGRLVRYEKSHANREDVVTMFERRIARLETGDG
jgi:hypothetical protein